MTTHKKTSPFDCEPERRPRARQFAVVETRRVGDRRSEPSGSSGLTRRAALGRLSAGTLLALGMWPGALRAEGRGGGRRFRFLVVNDTHAVSPECGGYFDGLARQMKQEQAEFCLHAGDVTDKGEQKYFGLMKETFATFGRPWYPVIGNHDYRTQTDRKAYTSAFPLRINYYFTQGGWQFVGLDSSEGQHADKTEIQPATFQWLDDYLWRLNKRKPTVVFTHFPMGAGVKYRPANADALLERFLEFNLQAVFCGHYHSFTERFAKDISITTNKCCSLKRGNHDGTQEKGYFVCDAGDGKLTRRFVEYKPA